MVKCGALFACVFLAEVAAAFAEENVAIDHVLEVLIPTMKSDNLQCQNSSVFYVQELKKLKVWATEMFDASSKFPTGILSGSVYDLGNFDECLGVEAPNNEEKIVGRYCLAKFHIDLPDFVNDDNNYCRFYAGKNFGNASVWEKVISFSHDRSRNSRNDFYFSYCIPSSCQHEDLEASLQYVTEKFNAGFSDFKLTASVDPLSCQLKNDLLLSIPDICFLSIVFFFALIIGIATGYDWLTKLDDLKAYKFHGTKHKSLIAFSMWSNLKKLSTESENDDGLQCIHGLKVISMFLIIMGHRIMFSIGSPLINPTFVENMYGKIEASVLLNGPIIVDTFFNISGFLVCYLMLVELKKRNRNINFIFLYIHRFVRLTPAYAVILAFYCTVFIKTGSGPFWLQRVQVEQERCIASWWANIFYLNNYIHKERICMFQSWYLTCDMHFFLVAPVIIWLLRKKPCLGLAALFAIVILSISIVFAVVYLNEEDAILLLYMKFLKDPVVNNTFKNVYIPTHMRASPYFVGMITGYLKYVMRSKQFKMPKCMVYMGWITCTILIEVTIYSAFIFYIPGREYDPLTAAMYSSMHHFTWSICISWMIIAISEGYGAWVQPILAWKPLILLSRITYTAFLAHGAIQIYSVATLRHPNYASIFNLVFHTLADISLAYICGLLLSMMFEAPIIALEKLVLRKDNIVKNEQKREVVPKINVIDQF